MNLTIGKKLSAGFGLCIIIMLAMAGYSMIQLNTLRELQDEGATRAEDAVRAEEAGAMGLVAYQIVADAQINRNLDETAREWAKVKKEIDEDLKYVAATVDTDKERELIRKAVEHSEFLIGIFEKDMLPLLKRPADEATMAVLRELDGKIDEQVGAIHEELEEISLSFKEEMKVADAEFDGISGTIVLVNTIMAIIGLVGSILIAVFITRSITRPLNSMAASADAIAAGNLEEKITVKTQDEIGKLADSLRIMVKNIKEKVDLLNKIPTPVMAVDKNFSITYMNPAGAGVGGLTQEQCTGKKCFDIFKTEQCNTDKCAVRQAMSKDAIVTEKTIARPNAGTTIPIQYTGAPLKNERGEIVGALEYVADITDIDRMMKETEMVVNTVADVMKSASDRDLSKRVVAQFSQQFQALKDNVNATLDNLDNALSQVQSSVEQVTTASTQISSGSQTLSQGAQEQASSLEEISSSLEEMASMTKQNSENANQAKSLSAAAAQSAEQGNGAMKKMSDAINMIKKSSDATAKIIKTIDEIAFQTNLLALNAAVEAARAGEAGRGFAVVAEEVRNLASRSAEAAKNTAGMIEESVKNAEGGVVITQEVAKFLNSINEGTGKVNDLIAEIAAASDEQSKGIEQVNGAVGQMNQITQQNAANSEESASAAEELTSQAQELAGMVGTFKLSNSGAPAQQKRIPARTAQQPRLTRGSVPNGKANRHAEEMLPMDTVDLRGF